MKKHGFTIVELLAVITLLGVLSLISVPLIDSTIEKNKQRLYDSQINTIKEGLKNFAATYTNLLPKDNGMTLNVDLETLKGLGLVKSDIKNPTNNECFYNNMNLIIKRKSKNYEYIVDKNSGYESKYDCESRKNFLLETEQVMLLYGDKTMSIDSGSTFKDPGVAFLVDKIMSTDVFETVIKNSSGTEINSIPTSTAGEYTIEYIYKSYVDEDKIFKEFKQSRKVIVKDFYNELILNGAKPKLDSGLIPITIESDGTVKKADQYSGWYNYESKMWANAVIVKPNKSLEYRYAQAETAIKKEDIVGQFVWIPRYKYKILTSGTATPSSTEIIFENKDATKSVGNAKTEYLTHPAFTLGDIELNGLWVSKFEMTGTSDEPTSLPNSYSLVNQNVKSQFDTAKKFNSYLTSSDAHMMKNTEYSAILYLAQSDYGIDDTIILNKNAERITGCGSDEQGSYQNNTCEYKYGTVTEYPQSTTNNINGIFDLSGGTWERVMGIYDNGLSLSGFSSLPESKYYDLITKENNVYKCNSGSCLGHGFDEVKLWYNANDPFVDNETSWLARGGMAGHSANYLGAYNYFYTVGSSSKALTFRTIIS